MSGEITPTVPETIRIIPANPAGNKTIFVLTPIERKNYQKIASYLLSLKEYAAEQIAFVLPSEPGCDGRMEMCGLEFCGNASRTFGLIQAKKLGLSGQNTVRVQVSGCPEPLAVEVNTDTCYTKIQMQSPLSISNYEDGLLVDLGGILHLIVTDRPAEMQIFTALKDKIMTDFRPPALGVMFFSPETCEMVPVVYVADVDTTYFEGSCASGTIALITALTQDKTDGIYTYTVKQPCGQLTASIKKKEGQIDSVSIEGPVTLGDAVTITLPLE